ncbi:magnesium transporter [Intrasporangium oryzae NRRL B-24470]|uniref:Magnesium transporter n=1 Tax=Intrasporangium oryzae NRRL B-24470 TaxID=1386089 RepID=W9G245_9MICO|nr:CorA family divalent cation transporter [Intrasporangium oryzae]EWT00181.1 magnesium transporter [Intrasporangium oryzae NRRL B-24470]
MQVSFVTGDGITDHPSAEVEGLLQRADGFVWLDVPEYDADADALLAGPFRAHALVRQACAERNFVPTVHAYEHQLFVILHAPLAGEGGHVHVLELDLIVGERYLVTVHGPRNPVVREEAATEETRAVRARIEAGRLRPATANDLAYAIASALARRQSAAVRAVANRLPALEAKVMAADFHRPEELLEELFLLRHELMTSRTMAAQAHDIQARVASLERFVPDETRRHARDLAEQFDRVRGLADGEVQFLVGVIDLYQTRVTTKMTVAMERLAVIAAITLPVTAIASIYGMNLIGNEGTDPVHLTIVLAVMTAISLWLLRWARRQGWW